LELLTPPATPETGCIRVFADKLDTPALRPECAVTGRFDARWWRFGRRPVYPGSTARGEPAQSLLGVALTERDRGARLHETTLVII
jgi:hypothetical protein